MRRPVLARFRVCVCALGLLCPVFAAVLADELASAQPTDETPSLSKEAVAIWARAIAADDVETLNLRLQDQADGGLIDATSETGKTALMVAAKMDDLELAEALLAANANIHATTQTGGTALMFTALGTDIRVAQRLLASGASVDAVGSNGWTAVTIAAARGFSPMLAWLLSEGASATRVDVYGYTPLMRAIENGHGAAARVLLDTPDPEIDHQDEFGNTALHHAARTEREDLVTLLLAAGADAGIRNRDGQLPLPE